MDVSGNKKKETHFQRGKGILDTEKIEFSKAYPIAFYRTLKCVI